MIEQLLEQAKVSPEHVYEIVVAGNTTMQQLLCGVDPSPLGQMPYVPACNRALRLEVREQHWPIHPHGRVYIMPVVSGFVGGDIVAGILATGLHEATGPTLMMDLGTNGEIVLMNQGQLWAASTAAGPAFEGARIRFGMRATKGAIEKVNMDQDLTYEVIGGGPATGI